MKPKFRSLIAAFHPLQRAAIVVTATVCAAAAHADQTWTGASDTLWDTAGNWNSAVPGAGENAVFDASSTANLSIDTNVDQSVGGIVLTSPAGPVSISNNALTLGAGGIDMSGATQDLTIGSNVTLAGSLAQEWSVASGQTLTVNGTLSRENFGHVNFNLTAGGTISIPSGTASALIPGATYNNTDLAALDGSKNVAPAASVITYVNNPNTGAATPNAPLGNWGPVDVIYSNTASGWSAWRASSSSSGSTYLMDGVRFGTANANGSPWVVEIKGGSAQYLNTENFQILVTPAVDTDVIFQSSVNGLRTNKDLTLDLSNFSSKSLIFTCGISEGGGKPGRMEKNGPGDVVFASTFGQTMTNGWSINEGTVYVGNGGAAGQLSGGAVHLAAGTTLSFNRSDAALVQATDIEGPGQVTMIGTGVATLSGNNTYSGGTTVTSGLIGASAISNLGTGDINLNGGGVQFAAAFDLTANNLVVGSSGATFNTNGNDVTFANAFQTGSTGQITVTGAGSLSIDADQDYSGGTSVDGKLLANALTSSTGSGAVTVNSGGTLGGDGAISGDVTIGAGGIIAPGNSVGELTVGTLNLAASSTGVLEFNVSPANDHIVVSSGGGLTIDGGAFELVQEGTTSPFSTPGTYNLISYSGSIGGAGVSALSVSNQQPGFSYTFAATGTEVTLTIATSGVVSEWITDGSGLWTDGANWSAAIPDGAGETALFTTSLTAPSSVDLNGAKTVGAMSFDSANGYTLTQGSAGALNLNSGTVDPVLVAIVDGVHEVAADVALTSTLAAEALDAADGLNISGAVSGAGGVTKTGDGTLGLLGANTFTGDVNLGGGSTTFASGGLGAGSNLGLDNATLVWDSGNTDDVSSKTVTFGTDPVSFDTNGNDVTLANPIGNSGASAFTKAGTGTLELSADATFTGGVTIADGVLQLGSGAAAGSVIGNIANTGVLSINRSDNVSLTNVISGTGGLNQIGSGDLALPVANTFSGDTNILSGTLTLQDAAALQNSTLNYGIGGGSLSFDTLTAATLGGLSGDKDLALENTTPAGVALTVGGNGSTTTYSGVLSGTGASLQKNGAGVLTLAGANTYDGATFVNEGTLEVTGSINGTIIACGDGDIINVNGGTITSSTFCDIEGDLNITGGGIANYNGGVRGDNSDASVINVIDGTLNATVVERRRDANFGESETGPTAGPGAAPNVGLVVGSSGTANIDSANIGTSNTGGCVVVDGGILNVSGTFAM
ncbi:MAG: autotransporter-associated beta strand repeat-containing protein, partial [Verrucomicrobiae bacterium]|nr:autotransporter-associated beta strand repeat-containing protein [Verrucomicrobiae bacterium]